MVESIRIFIKKAVVPPVEEGFSLWSIGQNDHGELGQGDRIDRSSPTQIGTDDWVDISSGYTIDSFFGLYAIGIKSDNTLWEWGATHSGNYSSPTQIGALSDWSQVSSRQASIMAIKTDGTLWGIGNNEYGQLGDGTIDMKTSPVQVGTLTDWEYVSSDRHTLALKTDGTLWAWGYNELGQLGQGNIIDRSSPVQVGSSTWSKICAGVSFSYGIKTDGTLWWWGAEKFNTELYIQRSSPTQIGSATDWAYIHTDGFTHFAIKTNGELWGWGKNQRGQLFTGALDGGRPLSGFARIGTDSDWLSIYVGTFAVKNDGTVWVAGNNSNGELGLGYTSTSVVMPEQFGMFTNFNKAVLSGYQSFTLFTE